MKRLILFLLSAAAGVFAGTDQSPPQAAQTNSGPLVTAVDGYAARVNSTIITYGEVRDNVMPYVQQMRRQLTGDALARGIQQAFLDARESLLEEALLKEEVKTLGLSLPDPFVEEETQRLIRERFNGDRTLLARALAARRMTFEEWRKEVSDQLTLRVYYDQEVTRRASVSEQAVREEYERTREDYFIPFAVRYRSILINRGRTPEEEAVKRKQAEDIVQKLRDGAGFAALAADVSDGNQDISPWRSLSDVREELRPALRDTPAGQSSGVIEAGDLFYIVKVEERREEGYTPFESARSKIEAKLLAAERAKLHEALMKRLAAKHFVERY